MKLLDYLEGLYEYKDLFRLLYEEISRERIEAYQGIYRYPIFEKSKFPIYGLPEVKEELVKSLCLISKYYDNGNNGIKILVMVGPSGSGKTEIGKFLDILYSSIVKKGELKTFYVVPHRNENDRYICPFNDNPIAILTSIFLNLDTDLSEDRVNELRSKYNFEICYECKDFFRKYITSKKDILSEIYVVNIFPNIVSIDFSSPSLEENLKNIIKNSNRGILHINVDDFEKFGERYEVNLQKLMRIADWSLNFSDGTSLRIELLPIVYSTEKFLDVIRDKRSLQRRSLVIYVRRNLSYSNEVRIINKFGLPFEHFSPYSLQSYAKIIVSSRIDENNSDDIKKLVEIYEKFENYEKLSESDFARVRDRIINSKPPKDGWKKGISSDKAFEILQKASLYRNKRCFTDKDLFYIYEINLIDKTDSDSSYVYEVFNHIRKNIFKDVIISFLMLVNNLTRNEIEENFEILRDLYRIKSGYTSIENLERLYGNDKRIDYIKSIIYRGEEEKVMDEIRAQLLLSNEVFSKIDEFVNSEKRIPSFFDILDKYPELIRSNENLRSFLPWNQIESGLDEENKNKLKSLIERMKSLGYCDECALDAIKIFTEKIS